MATTKLMLTCRPLGLTASSSSLTVKIMKCSSKMELNNGSERKSVAAVKSTTAASAHVTEKLQGERRVDLSSKLSDANNAVFVLLRIHVSRKSWRSQLQIFIERGIIDCRFFTLLAVAGSLLGSILCFMEGSLMISKSYLHYFHALSRMSDQSHIVHLLIEAIDMFLIGTAMLVFGMGLYAMFVGTNKVKAKGEWLQGSNLFGLFHMKTAPTWLAMQSVSEAKSKIGHAMMMILQVGVLEKLKCVNVASGLDLACIAGAVFFSSVSVFILSRLYYVGSSEVKV